MNESSPENSITPDLSPKEVTPETSSGAASSEPPAPHTPVKRISPAAPRPKPAKIVDTRPAEDRRDFFSDAMREALIPLSGILERKINPILAALEAIPDDVDRLTNNLPKISAALDQPQRTAKTPRNWPLGETAAEPVRFLRPPGAVAPGQFESRCSACGKCVEACPAQAIRMDSRQLVADGLPYIIPATQPCVVCTDLACMNVCPTGALKLTDRLKIHMGTARVNLDLCRREEGEDCRLCLEACPIMGEGAGPAGDALAIHASSGRVMVRRNACVGCGLCESRCPTNPAAITIEPYRAPVDPIIA